MSLKVRDVIEAVRTMAGVTASVDTVDTIKTGDPLSEVSGIVTTFTATPGVIRKAGELGASLTCEWSVCEYMRDAHELGIKKGCIVLGHRNSEEFGMKYLAERIRPLFPQVPVSFVPAGDPFGSI